MFRHMQNSEIIRKMTEEFDEVCKCHGSVYNTNNVLDKESYMLKQVSRCKLVCVCVYLGQRRLPAGDGRSAVEKV